MTNYSFAVQADWFKAFKYARIDDHKPSASEIAAHKRAQQANQD